MKEQDLSRRQRLQESLRRMSAWLIPGIGVKRCR
jgi:hypothetical protein